MNDVMSDVKGDVMSNSAKAIRRESAADAELLAKHLATDVAAVLSSAIAERGSASLVVSGGGTPKPMFEYLSRFDSVDWSKVKMTLADERAVPVGHEDSNESFVHQHLLTASAAGASYVSLLPENLQTLESLAAVGKRIDDMGQPFDLVLLGMGGDGHTASLFPDAPELESAMNAEQSVVALHPPSVAQARISLSGKRLVNTRMLWLHIAGDGKRAVLDTALAEGTLPIARVFDIADPSKVDRRIYQTG